MKQSGGVQDSQLLLARAKEERRRQQHQERMKPLPLMATVAALVPEAMAGLLPKPKRFDCPKCRRAQLQRSRAMSYCLRCSHTERT